MKTTIFVLSFIVLWSCHHKTQIPIIFLADASRSTVSKFDPVSSKASQLASAQGFVWRIAVDPVNKKLFWSNVDHNFVMSSDLDGSNLDTVIFVTYPQGIALDPQKQWIYISEAGTPLILRSSYDGTKVDTLVTDQIYDVDDIRLDAINNLLFYVDLGSESIGKLDIESRKNTTLIVGKEVNPISLEIDVQKQIINWGDNDGAIYSTNYSGQGITTVVEDAGKPTSLAFDSKNNDLYWIDVSNQKLSKIDLSNGSITEITDVPLNNFHMSMALYQ